ncbi:hypothetical protein [Vibrio fluvialis]|uniref:hypothetical protein n=1 Tax=Vibrio fluvialis TaxID=676 RepID=UPI003D7EA408
MKIELTQDQYQQLKEFGLANSEIKSYGCTHPSRGVTVDHFVTIGVKKPVTCGAEWSGEGLPPVGTVCQYKDTNQWFNVEITYLSDWVIVFKCLDESGCFVSDIKGVELAKNVDEHPEFRKPETEAERNERERLEAAYDLYCAWRGGYCESFDVFRVCNVDNWLAIVDKTGYRKAVTNE